MTWESIVLALVSGLVGVAVGAVVTAWQHKSEQDRLDRAAARATFFELTKNVEYLRRTAQGNVSIPLVSSTWHETRARLAASLTPRDLTRVATTYMTLETVEHGRSVRSFDHGPRTTAAAAAAVPEVDSAIEVLARLGWPDRREREQVEESVAEILHGTAPASDR